MNELVVVARYTYRHEAEFAAGFLRDAGIPCGLAVDDAGGHIAVSNTASVSVAAERLDEARAVLKAAGLETT